MKKISITAIVLMLVAALGACASSAYKEASREKRNKLVATNVSLGVEYMQRGKLVYAKEKFDKALELDSNNSHANNAMAFLLWKYFKDFDKADYHFSRATSIDPDNAESLNSYGVFLCERGKISEAVKRFDKALLNPLYKIPAQANLNAGLCLMKAAKKIEAEKYFRTALKHDPKLPKALYQMALISYGKGRALSARGFMERFFAVGKDTSESLYLAARIEKFLGDRNAAASYRVRLKGRFPDSPEAKTLKKIGRR